MSNFPLFDRSKISFQSVKERISKIQIEPTAKKVYYDMVPASRDAQVAIAKLSLRIEEARENNKPVVLCMGAHPIKNGACLLINDMVNQGIITHVAGNGASAIHDWEFARFGKSTECVRTYVSQGQFGLWSETGVFFGLSAQMAHEEDKGWGEKIGELILGDISFCGSYRYPQYSVMANCARVGIPYTIHPGIGQDIIYSHPYADEDVGCAITDFLIFAEAIKNLEGGVYLSVGSSVMSPMIFEKALSMSRNIEMSQGRKIENFLIAINDLADSNWDWDLGEPPMSNPAYYIRFMKSFNRMGGDLEYYGLHNVTFLKHLHCCF